MTQNITAAGLMASGCYYWNLLKLDQLIALVCERAFLIYPIATVGELGNIERFLLSIHREDDDIFLVFSISGVF